jgi:subtilisin family serine protease
MKVILFNTIFFLFSFIFTTSLFSQEVSDQQYQQGEILVQLEHNADIERLISDYNSVGLQIVQTVSARFNIYLLKFDPSRSSNASLLNIIRPHKLIVNAQNNHLVTMRDVKETTPDDLFFNLQWALENTGQNGGYAGSDIDATNAWDITTGGLSAHGDTIVIAIIDGGFDLTHEDLDFWKNRAEIPNNNIDDDNNGYVDDYDGWNAYNHTGDLPMNIHGTHVSGIAGAIGNNEVGVSGVNWNAKLLAVAGDSPNEAIVVEALSYVYVIRETYDQTDGEEGAFVVVDNCSFGVNKGDPVNYPIWEAMYDSLGQLGVLSVGATANANWDIDSVGDIPTAFSTDYLISVTNTTNKDQKNPNAAYGATTIDLGAPGTIIASCYPNNEYKTKTGTSMAAPQVAGAVALLIAAGDSAFIDQYKNNPTETSLLVKNAILFGVDTISDLMGKTVTGGRLNLFNSLQLLLNSPILYVNPSDVAVEILKENTLNDTLTIKNIGADTLNYSVTIEDQPEWILLSQISGSLPQGESDELILMFDAQGLDTGYYYCSISIDGNFDYTQTIPVEMHVVSSVGITDAVSNTSNVTVYPNPFSESVTFKFNHIKANKALLQIYDLAGKQVYSYEYFINNSNAGFKWQSSGLDKGVYFYKIILDNAEVVTGKLMRK